MALTLSAVLQFWREAACRTPRTFTAVTAAIIATPASLWVSGVSGTSSPR